MKVRVTLTLEVDPEAWEKIYGVEPIWQRDDVKKYVLGCVQGSDAADEGALVSVRRAGR